MTIANIIKMAQAMHEEIKVITNIDAASLAVIQGTDEWKQARAGKITASKIYDMQAKPQKEGAGLRANYLAQLAVERLTGKPMSEGYKNDIMQRGNDVEPMARAAYEFFRGVTVQEVGFVHYPEIGLGAFTGASPDGLVDPDGCVQIKCPMPAEHIRTLMGKEIDNRYILQMQWEMACADRQWCDFVSYHPEFPDHLQLFVKRIPRDNDKIAEIKLAVMLFNSEINDTMEKLRNA